MVLVTAVRDYVNRMLQDISGMKVLILDSQTLEVASYSQIELGLSVMKDTTILLDWRRIARTSTDWHRYARSKVLVVRAYWRGQNAILTRCKRTDCIVKRGRPKKNWEK